jgi:phosphoserine aminotransferase
MSGLRGHRSVGGMRASIYNAFPEEGVARLVGLLQELDEPGYARRGSTPEGSAV